MKKAKNIASLLDSLSRSETEFLAKIIAARRAVLDLEHVVKLDKILNAHEV